MAAMSDVSKSLDMIGNTPGQRLVRGQKYWEAQTGPAVAAAALVQRSSNWIVGTVPEDTRFPYNEIAYDTGGFILDPANPHTFTIPAGMTSVILQATLNVQHASANRYGRIIFYKNGSRVYPGTTWQEHQRSGTTLAISMASGLVPCQEGDTFDLRAWIAPNATFTFPAITNNFSIRAS